MTDRRKVARRITVALVGVLLIIVTARASVVARSADPWQLVLAFMIGIITLLVGHMAHVRQERQGAFIRSVLGKLLGRPSLGFQLSFQPLRSEPTDLPEPHPWSPGSAPSTLRLTPQHFDPVPMFGWRFYPGGPLGKPPASPDAPEWSPDLWPNDSTAEALSHAQWLVRVTSTWAIIVGIGGLLGWVADKTLGVVMLALCGGLITMRFFETCQIKRLQLVAASELDRSLDDYEDSFRKLRMSWVQSYEEYQRNVLSDWRRDDQWKPLPIVGNLDVIGGSRLGWESVITTASLSSIAAGRTSVVLDFSEDGVCGPLLNVVPESQTLLWSWDGSALDAPVLPAVSRKKLATMIIGAYFAPSARETRAELDQHDRDVGIVSDILACLDEPVTVGALSTAIDYIHTQQTPLSEDEFSENARRSLDGIVLSLTATTETRQRLETLRHQISRLSAFRYRDFQEPGFLDGNAKLRVIATDPSLGFRERRPVNGLLAQILLTELTARTTASQPMTVIVAGADWLGEIVVRELKRATRTAKGDLLLLFERGDHDYTYRDAEALTLIMQLPRQEDAAAAARHFGESYEIRLSQVTRSVTEGTSITTGDTVTSGISKSDTTGGGSSWSKSSSSSGQRSTSVTNSKGAGGRSSGTTDGESSGWSESHTVGGNTTWSHTEGTTRSWSESVQKAESESRQVGETELSELTARVRPDALRELPPTAFLILPKPGVPLEPTTGDCNPAITAYPGRQRLGASS